MDPLSALSISAAVVQFAEFGYRLLKSAHKIYKASSETDGQSINIETVSSDLARLADEVESKLHRTEGGVAEDIFRHLCQECRATEKEIESILSRIRAQGSNKVMLAASSWVAALRKVTKGSEIDDLAERLGEIQQQMVVAMLSLLLGEARNSGVELRQFAKMQNGIVEKLDRIDASTKKFSANLVGLLDETRRTEPVERARDAMISYVFSSKWEARDFAKVSLVDIDRDKPNVDRVLENLFFVSMGSRETDIPQKYAETFEWVFHSPRKSEDGQARWSDLPNWLKGDSQEVYWITGKPGAGKSTLIKFIGKDPRLREHLAVWANGSPLIIAGFFAWNAGTEMLQKTHEGLFRTLLLEVLQQRPQLVATLFPARWFLVQSFGQYVQYYPPTYTELEFAFKRLSCITGDTLKLALIIDGLDELDDDHKRMVQLLREINISRGVKICVSSRPWNVFKDEYATSPMLQLEKLTREDIQYYVKSRLELSPGYQTYRDTNPNKAGEIITNLVNKAEGVFLWVAVISGMLENSFQEGARIKDLEDTIEALPVEISDLFQFIWKRTSSRFRADASQYFQVMKACQMLGRSLYALTLWFGDNEIPVDMDPWCLTDTYLLGALKALERMLISRTGGLLEVFPDPQNPAKYRVDYMHRTAIDWVKENWDAIVSVSDDMFDASLWILKGEVLRLTSSCPGTLPEYHSQYIWDLARISSTVRTGLPANGPLVVQLFDRFDTQFGNGREDFMIELRVTMLELSPLQRRISSPNCPTFLHLAAFIPIPTYVEQKASAATPESSPDDATWESVLYLIIFSEIWCGNNAQVRHRLLESVLKKKSAVLNLDNLPAQVDAAIKLSLSSTGEHDYLVSMQRILEGQSAMPDRGGTSKGGKKQKGMGN